MTRISFYILPDNPVEGLAGFACRLAEKVLQSGTSAYLLAADEAMSEHLDEALWNGQENSFIPHERWSAQAEVAQDIPLLLGCDEPPHSHHQVLINLGQTIPLYFSRFERLLEIVDSQGTEAGRQRYQFYRERGYPLEMHRISA